ncbi:hypothetical protein OC835_006076, partial [Tilletia horrida]
VATASAYAAQVGGDDAEPAPLTQPLAEPGPFQHPNNSEPVAESRTGDGEVSAEIAKAGLERRFDTN